jgi:hypothetical protein
MFLKGESGRGRPRRMFGKAKSDEPASSAEVLRKFRRDGIGKG